MPPTLEHNIDDGPLSSRIFGLEPGTRVVLGPGVHRGPIALPHDVELVAAGGLGSATLMSARGPALSLEGASRVHVEGLVLRGAEAGAASIVQVYMGADLRIEGCLLSGGSGRGEGGGAVDVQQGRVYLERCRITRCVAPQGAGLRAAGAVLVTIESAIFAENRATGAGGGALFATRGAEIRVVGATFAGNSGERGSVALAGGGAGGAGTIAMRSCLIAADAAGEALWAERGGRLELSHSLLPRGPGEDAGVVLLEGAEVRRVDVAPSGERPYAAAFAGLLAGRGDRAAFASTTDVYGISRGAIWVGAVG